jgi:drug/metabolite transporter (DMT)-like permease
MNVENKEKNKSEIHRIEELIRSRRMSQEISSKRSNSKLNELKEDFLSTEKTTPVPSQVTTTGYSERISLLIFLISNICFGFTSFHIKYMSKEFPDLFNANNFAVWRCFALLVISSILIWKNNERLIKPWEIKSRFWFLMRTMGNFTATIFFVLAALNLRVATVSCISAMNPILVLIFSIIILKDKFYTRYLFGLLICFTGAYLIVGNERKPPVLEVVTSFDDQVIDIVPEVFDSLKFAKGVGFGFLHLLSVALVIIGVKVIAVEKITTNEQCNYLGTTNIAMGVVAHFVLPNMSITFNSIGFILGCALNGAVFYLGTYFFIEALKGIAINKVSPLSYINTLTVFTLGVIFFGESIYFTDLIGSGLILAFNAYNSMFPIK